MSTPHLHLALTPTGNRATLSEPLAIRVVLADNHALMRRSLRLLLEGEPDMDVVAQVGDLASALDGVHQRRPDVLVLDLSMPGGSSIKAIGRLREEVPETQIVALTMDDSPVFARGALAAGAVGFVVKELADSELPQAVRSAARGEEYVSRRVAGRLAIMQRAGSRPRPRGV
jgi:two-component system, NarL family, response regulator NreC